MDDKILIVYNIPLLLEWGNSLWYFKGFFHLILFGGKKERKNKKQKDVTVLQNVPMYECV